MAQNSKNKRGRPRAYNKEVALKSALEVFWKYGFTGASLDKISAATQMNRPSLFAAFGDKKSIYRKSMEQFNRDFFNDLETALFNDLSLEEDLVNFYLSALSVYQSKKTGPLGCPVICTATTEAAVDSDIQTDLANALDQIDLALMSRFKQAIESGQLSSLSDPEELGQLAAALLHSLAIRTRAKQPIFEVERFIKSSVAKIIENSR